MRTVLAASALALGAVAAFLPSESAATLLAGADSERLALVERGVGIFKVALGFHAALLLALAFAPLQRGRCEPLLTRGLNQDRTVHVLDNWIVAFLLAIAGALRTFDLGDGLWFDEIDTLVRYGREPLGKVISTFDSQNQHLLYSVLARIVIGAYGESAAALRLPAAILGVASLWALWHFARLVTDRREALFATALLAFSYHHVWFSQNARGYTGLLFFTLVASGLFLRMLGASEARSLLLPFGYGLSMALAVATHVTALFVVAAHGFVWLALLWSRRGLRIERVHWMPGIGFVLAGSFALLCYAFVLPQMVEVLTRESMPGAATEWQDPLWLVRATLAGLARGVPGGWLAVVVGVVVVGLGLWSYARQSLAVLAVMLLGAVLTALAIIALRHNLWPRFFFFSAGFGVLLVFRGVFSLFNVLSLGPFASLRKLGPKLAWVGATLLVLASAATLPRAYGPKQDFRGALEFVRAASQPGDAVVTVAMTNLPYQKLFSAGWGEVDTIQELLSVESNHPRTWVVYTTPMHLSAEQPEIWDRLLAEYEEAKVFPGTVAGGEVVVRVRR